MKIIVFLYRCLSLKFVLDFVYTQIIRLRLSQCGTGLRLTFGTAISGHRNIRIGNNFVSMGRLALYANDGGELIIGDDCDVNSNVQLGAANGRIIIGNKVMFAPNVVVRAANHGMKKDKPMKDQPSVGGIIQIGDDVWVGANAVITADVTVATGTIIAAGAVVTRSTEAFSIVGGVPARKIGERI